MENELIIRTDAEIDAARERLKVLVRWALHCSNEQINFLLDSGFYNDALKGYMIAALRDSFTKEQIEEFVQCMAVALDSYSKEYAERIYRTFFG